MNDGFILIDKPANITSHDVVNIIREKFSTKKVGHSGTLDPFATGLLILGINKGTRLLEYLQHQDKKYYVKAKLGIITDTYDITGEVKERYEVLSNHIDDLEKVILSFKGKYLQVPPMYSAKKYNGKKLYELARAGKIIKMPPKEVNIYSIDNIKIYDNGEFEFECKVSSGTYIRSLIMDIGYKIGVGAVTTELRRLEVGKFNVDDAIKLDNITKKIIPMIEVLDFPKIILNKIGIQRALNGNHIFLNHIDKYEDFKKDDIVSLIDEKNNLIAISIAERNSTFLNTLEKHDRNERIFKIKKVFK
ncbi:tRNA pseudouridine(55) synthase TruB [Marinitoga sp. 38H-ov]|uniref:tRNA pseudouridine(55) synthase TruB n=1 Tax=Marinitoga sp. 38H-ov TaxID=1755814 RepID=UPI0013EC42FA|nr:tRNA pseudouridine(55) synthase TruB [Marinitoga sp. 38H-ov]KAF2956758.1 tRNA pseudouridine synthase B [Marinitoga sp. 38H-ov]